MPTVRLDVHDAIAEVALNRAESANALDLATAGQLHDCLVQVRDDDAVHVLLLRGEGRMFCSGGDLAGIARSADRAQTISALAAQAHRCVRLLNELTKPVIIAVQGAAAGIGFSLVLGADIVIAAENARFVTAYTSVGLSPDGGMSWLLPRVVGQQRATELLLTGRPLDATEALTLGIVSQVCAEDSLLRTAREAANQLSRRSPQALAATRRLVRSSWENTLDAHLDREARSITRAVTDEDTAERISAFLSRSRR